MAPQITKCVSCETNLILPTCQIWLAISLKAVTEIAPLFIHKIVKVCVFIDAIILQVICVQLKTTCKNKN